MRSRKNLISDVENLDICENEEEGFIEGGIGTGKTLAAFTFGSNNMEEDNKALKVSQRTLNTSSTFFMAESENKTTSRGLTPAVNGEPYTIKRGYLFRPSTLRKLNELKANHPDINVYLNTIIDEVIVYYYQHVFNSKGTEISS